MPMPATLFALPLVAAGLDWLEGLLPVLFVLFWIVSQIWGVVRRAAGPAERAAPRPAGQQRRPRPAAEPPQPDGVRGRLEEEIEAFLREADRSRAPETAAAEPRRPTPPKRPARPVRSQPGKPPVRRAERADRSPEPPARPAAAATAGGSGQPPLPPVFGSDVARHVSEAFATDLRHQMSAPAAAELPTAQPTGLDIGKLLRDPASLRNLIVVREVLDRPVERW